MWDLRKKQVKQLEGNSILSMDQIESLCQEYRDFAQEVLRLLDYLEFNVTKLRRIVKKHDKQFDIKMGSIYFDARLNEVGSTSSNSQLLQLYHQEGLRAIIGTLRRGFEELYEARDALRSIQDFKGPSNGEGLHSRMKRKTSFTSLSGSGGGSGIPKTSYMYRLAANMSMPSNMNELLMLDASSNTTNSSFTGLKGAASNSSAAGGGDHAVLDDKRFDASQYSQGRWDGKKLRSSDNESPVPTLGLVRNISDVEPVLKRISELSERVLESQQRTTSEYLASHSIMALENKREEEGSDDEDEEKKKPSRVTSGIGLFLNLLVTFLYMANQYVVAPTSGQYSEILGESKAMSGLIIGLSPTAALVSALFYSKWTNYSFKEPLVTAITFAVAGNLLYGLALQNDSETMIFLGRLLSGLGAPRGIARRYIADHVSHKHRTIASSHFVTAGALGLAFGPLISSIVTSSNYSFTIRFWGDPEGLILLQFENVTAPGWIMTFLWLIALVAVLLAFEEPARNSKGPSLLSAVSNLAKQGDAGPKTGFWERMLSNPGISAITGETHRDDVEQIPPLQENVVSVELGDCLSKNATPEKRSNLKSTLQQESKNETTPLVSSYAGKKYASTAADATLFSKGSLPPPKNSSSSPRRRFDSEDSASSGGGGEGGAEVGKEDPDAVIGLRVSGDSTEDQHADVNSPLHYVHHADMQQKHHQQGGRSSNTRVSSSYLHPYEPLSADGYNQDLFPSSSTSFHHSHQNLPREQYEYLARNGVLIDAGHGVSGGGGNRYFIASSCWDYITIEVGIILFIYLVNKTGQEMVVSSIPTLTGQMFQWNSDNAGFFMAAMGALVLPANIYLSSFTSIDDRTMVPYLSYLSLASILLLIDTNLFDYSPFQYILGSSLLFAFLNALEGVIMSLLSKVVPPELAKGTFNSGLLVHLFQSLYFSSHNASVLAALHQIHAHYYKTKTHISLYIHTGNRGGYIRTCIWRFGNHIIWHVRFLR